MQRAAAALLIWLTCATALGQSSTFIDATDPPAGLGLTAADPTDSASDAAALNLLITHIRSNPEAILFLPPGTYIIDDGEEWNISRIDGLRILGGGLGRSIGGSSSDAYTRILCKGTTGPKVILDDVNGLVMDGLTFDAQSEDLDILVKHLNGADSSSTSLGLRVSNCGFWDAQMLWYNGDGAGTAGAADILFDNISWRAGHNNDSRARYAFYCTSEQNVHYTFMHNYFLQVGTALHFESGGRVSCFSPQFINVAQMIYRGSGGAGNAGFVVRDFYIDAQGTKRMIWLATEDNATGRTYGPFIFENGAHHGSYPSDGTNFAQISSWPGTTLNLAGPLDVRPGDRIKFYDQDDHTVVLAETTVVTRLSVDTAKGVAQYEVSDTCCDLAGLPSDLTTVDAAHGEALFELHGGENVTVRNCWFNDNVVVGKRLATLRFGTGGTGWVPLITFDNCIGWGNASVAGDLATVYLDDLSGAEAAYYRFRDAQVNLGADVFSATNIP